MYDPLEQEEFKQFYVDSGITKEQKYTIDRIVGYGSSSKSKNASIAYDMSPIKQLTDFDLQYLVCFQTTAPDNLLGSRKIFVARNITSTGFDLYFDTRLSNPNIPYQKINPQNYPNYPLPQNTKMFYKVSHILAYEYIRDQLFLTCDKSKLQQGTEVLVQNSNLGDQKARYMAFGTNILSSDDLGIWSVDSSEPFHTYGAIVVNHRYICLGNTKNDSRGMLAISEDGEKWTVRYLDNKPSQMKAIAYNEDSGLFVAVGKYSYYTRGPSNRKITNYESRIVVSNNGIDWELKNVLEPIFLNDIAFGNGLFIAVGLINTLPYFILSSSDGSNWNRIGNIMGVSVCFENNRFVLLESNGIDLVGNKIYVSNDGIDWTKTAELPTPVYRVKYINNVFVALSGSYIYTSPTGDNWTQHRITNNIREIKDIIYDGEKYIAVGNKYINKFANFIGTSVDLENWTEYPSGEFSNLSAIIENSVLRIDYEKTAKTYKVIIDPSHPNGVFIKNLDGSPVIISGGTLGKYAEIYKLVSNNNVANCDLGTNCVIQLKTALENNIKVMDKAYVNKVVGMSEINQKIYLIANISDNRKEIVLYDPTTSPTEEDLSVIDSFAWSEYDTSIDNNGNFYIYFQSVEGLNHLIGQPVDICADGNSRTSTVVPPSGVVNLDQEAMYCSIGLKMKSYFKTVPFSGGSAIGTSVGRIGSQKALYLNLYNSLGGKYGASENEIYPIKYENTKNKNMDQPKKLFTGLLEHPLPTNKIIFNRTIYVEHDEPLSFNVLSIAHDIDVSDS
jgi:hypothetical protein